MILDRENAFSIQQALTATAVSTDLIDLSQLRQIGFGKNLSLVINVDVAAGGTSPTLQVNVQTDDTARGAVPGSNMAVLRAKTDILRRSAVGAMYTRRGATPPS